MWMCCSCTCRWHALKKLSSSQSGTGPPGGGTSCNKPRAMQSGCEHLTNQVRSSPSSTFIHSPIPNSGGITIGITSSWGNEVSDNRHTAAIASPSGFRGFPRLSTLSHLVSLPGLGLSNGILEIVRQVHGAQLEERHLRICTLSHYKTNWEAPRMESGEAGGVTSRGRSIVGSESMSEARNAYLICLGKLQHNNSDARLSRLSN